MKKENLIGIEEHIKIFNDKLLDLKSNKGAIFCISGEEGYGKSNLINMIAESASEKLKDIKVVIIKIQAPIGNFNLGQIQPLMPFTKTMEKLITGETFNKSSALSHFLKNAGITMLASVPLIDTVFYAVKELGRDWREYQKDKSTEIKSKSKNTATRDFFDSLLSIANKSPLVICIDDFQWADVQSIELLNLFADNISEIPILLVLSYRKSILDSIASPMLEFISNKINNKTIFNLELKEFQKEEISRLAKIYIPNYKVNLSFENWLFDNTYGVPAVVIEYLKYFAENNPLDEKGELIENFYNQDFLPSNIYVNFSKSIENLSESDRNILSICSAEGREFTALVSSQLINKDILTTIKKLKHLQLKTGIIKSIGAHIRYGVKTTIYEFTQAFYKKYFEDNLEYEEKVALHGQIASVLKQKYQEADTDALKSQIAPYLAAHSVESGDNETAKSMILHSAKTAKEFGNKEIVDELFDRFNALDNGNNLDEDNPDYMAFKEIITNFGDKLNAVDNGLPDTDNENLPTNSGGGYIQDFSSVRKIAVEYYHKKKYGEAADYALNYYNKNIDDLRSAEKAQLLSLAIKSYLEINDMSSANRYAEIALKLVTDNNDPIAECFVMNTLAIYKYYLNDVDTAIEYLKRAANKSILLSPELKLLTLTNIALISDEIEPGKSNKYYQTIRTLTNKLNFEYFAEEVFQ